MAREWTVILHDDLGRKPATQTVQFALDENQYEIDLSDANAAALREVLNRYLTHGRRVGGRRTTQAAASDKDERTRIRAWARSEGLNVSKRGRISRSVVDLYQDQLAMNAVPLAGAARPGLPVTGAPSRKVDQGPSEAVSGTATHLQCCSGMR